MSRFADHDAEAARPPGAIRLTDAQRRAIVDELVHTFGPDARIVLFGSRADPVRRGGDIDLYLESATPVPLMQQCIAAARLESALDLKVDLLVRHPGEPEQPIHRIAKATGVRLR